jgi:Holliday junction DNA helicase RuvA
MFAFIQGLLREKTTSKIVVEAAGLGYKLYIPLSTFPLLPPENTPIHLFLSHVVREDAQTLYAFLKREERDLFEILIGLSGIGPKSALNLLSHLDPASFRKAIQNQDIARLNKVPGIGKKTAERLIVELKGHLSTLPLGSDTYPPSLAPLMADAISALLHLGYPQPKAQKAVEAAHLETHPSDLSQLISLALQKIS